MGLLKEAIELKRAATAGVGLTVLGVIVAGCDNQPIVPPTPVNTPVKITTSDEQEKILPSPTVEKRLSGEKLWEQEEVIQSAFRDIFRPRGAVDNSQLHKRAQEAAERWMVIHGETQVGPSTFLWKGQRYDLKNGTDLVLVAADINLRWAAFSDLVRVRTRANLEDLKGKVIIDTFKEESLIDPQVLSILSQTLRVLREHGREVPVTWTTTGGGSSNYDTQTNMAALGSRDFQSIAIAMSLAEYYKQTHPQYFALYKDSLEESFRKIEEKGIKIKNLDLALAPLESSGSMESSFRSALAGFIMDGVVFRGKLMYAKNQGFEAEALLLGAKYSSLRQSLGVEFTKLGQPWEEVDWKPGEAAQVYDHTPENPGIYLKDEPTAKIDLRWPSTRDGAVVIVNGGPEEVIFNNGNTSYVRKMYRVIPASVTELSGKRYAAPTPPLQYGWVPEDFLASFKKTN